MSLIIKMGYKLFYVFITSDCVMYRGSYVLLEGFVRPFPAPDADDGKVLGDLSFCK